MAQSTEKSKILIVDDNPKNIQVLGTILRKEGYLVEFATNGQQAIERIKIEKFDLLLLDIMMPVMDGITAIAELRAKYHKLPPIIGLSAHAQESNADYFTKLGMADFIEKPVNKAELIRRILKWGKA